MFDLSRLARMELSRDNPAVDYYLRLEALHLRGLGDAVIQMLWQAGDRTLLAQTEAASDRDLIALTAAAR